MGNKLIEALLKERYPGADTVYDYLTDEEAEELLEALPVLLDLALTFAAKDYNAEVLDSSQVYLGTFAYNMDTLISAHYPEINLAWLRSYDSFFEKDTTAYTIEAQSAKAPEGTLTSDGVLTLSAAPGSAVYYSVDNGETYSLYRRSSSIGSEADQIKAYAVSYGMKSSETVINKQQKPEETTSGQGNANEEGSTSYHIGYIIPSVAAVISAGAALLAVYLRKKRK